MVAFISNYIEFLHYAPVSWYTLGTNGFGLAPLYVGQNCLVLASTKESPLKLLADSLKHILIHGARFAYQAFGVDQACLGEND